ncbi:AAA family ATPase [Synechococcus sp. Lug-A]|uniref:ATP-dependent nuclease n=1 Tax=Synechococcus sp. Lug-A TaxID=2823740 RepID=UPI0020CDEDA2|nr:AAA family ATPase [Synechococcus sp. Lug-A]MCP9847651.1 AAA family ATPase [Synechococcus sp. Lug-A]
MEINRIGLRGGDGIDIFKFTVLVGPNNVGKSQTLKDIHARFCKGKLADGILVDDIFFDSTKSFEDYLEGLDIRDSATNIGFKTVKGITGNLIEGEQFEVHLPSISSEFLSQSGPTAFFSNIAKFKIAYLDAGTRLRVAQKTNSFNPHTGYPQNLLQAIYGNEDREKTLQATFRETFGSQIQLDYSGLTEFAFRVAANFGDVPRDPREAFKVMAKYSLLDDQGDGYKSFVGVVISLLMSENRVVLLDEPEAFLHPAQSRQLGFWIAEHSKTIPGQIIIATHNSNFLSGILASNQDVNIFRLNRKNNQTSFTLMSSNATSNLAKNPLLSSQRVLDAIFHRGVIVCEADADRAVYQSVATRDLGSQEFLFIHAHNKQAISTVTGLLKDAAIPVCSIADIDVVNDECLIKILESIGGTADVSRIRDLQGEVIRAVDNMEEQEALQKLRLLIREFGDQLSHGEHSLSGARGALNRLRKEASNWATVKQEGVFGVPENVQAQLTEIISLSKLNGLYIVPVGELEKWIDLGTTKKNKWIIPALESIYNEECPDALKSFVREVLEGVRT